MKTPLRKLIPEESLELWKRLRARHAERKLWAMILAPYVITFHSTPDKRNVSDKYQWMMTQDWDLAGDEPWRRGRLWGKDPLSWINRVRWLFRNGDQEEAYGEFGIPAEDTTYFRVEGSLDDLGTKNFGESLYLGVTRWDNGELQDVFYYVSATPFLRFWYIQRMQGWKINNEVGSRYKLIANFRIRRKGKPT